MAAGSRERFLRQALIATPDVMISALSFGQAIRASRKARGLTQAHAAEKAGLSRQAVHLLESGGGKVSTLLSVAEFAAVNVTYLRAGGSLGERVRAARSAKGMTATALACRASVAPNTVRAVEAGGGTVETLAALIGAVAPRASVKAAPLAKAAKPGFPTVLHTRNGARDASDHYPTPLPIVRLLLDHEPFTTTDTILEPAVGSHRVIERAFHERGHRNIVCRDIDGLGAEQQDFLTEERRHDVVVTNPPFRLHLEFILRAKRVARSKVVLLLPLNLLTGAGRLRQVWEDKAFPLARVYVLARGVDFTHPNPMSPTFRPSQMYVAWFVFERSHSGPPSLQWIDNGPFVEKSRRRASRRGPTGDMLSK